MKKMDIVSKYANMDIAYLYDCHGFSFNKQILIKYDDFEKMTKAELRQKFQQAQNFFNTYLDEILQDIDLIEEGITNEK